MHVMFVHQNFPAQFRYIAPKLVNDFGWTCTFVTEKAEGSLPGIEKVVYAARGHATLANHVCTRTFENQVGQAHGVYAALQARTDVRPDLIVAHSGFGSSLFLPYLYDAPIINFFEYFYRPVGQDLGYRPELSVTEVALLRSRTRNAMIMLDLDNCDRGWTPTNYQRDFLPREYREKVEVIFDGIDTDVYHRKPEPNRNVAEGITIPKGPRIVTYVARGFEMMRGFDIFMKVAKRIYEQFPDVVFVVVGTDRVHYGPDLSVFKARSFREHVLGSGEYDLSRFIFTGYVQQETLADILSMSDLHIYLTEPFIASWSMVDAMACGAVLLASDQKCVREYVTHGENGLLRDFFDVEGLAAQAIEVLRDPAAHRCLGDAAARTVQEKYSLAVALPRIKAFFEQVASKPREPSVRAELLVRKGIDQPDEDPDAELGPALVTGSTAGASEQTSVATTVRIAALSDVKGLSPLDGATKLLSEMASRDANLDVQIALVQNFSAPGEFRRIGPRNHPIDLRRMLQRIQQWDGRTVLCLGATEGGLVYLLTRCAASDAKVICAATPGVKFSPERTQFLKAMARERQQVVCVSGEPDWEQLADHISKALGGKKIDFIFMSGLRPAPEVRQNFRKFRNLVRRDGLFAWDGVQPVVALDDQHDGGDRLWQEVRPMYPQRAEYLAGVNGLSGGIVMVKV